MNVSLEFSPLDFTDMPLVRKWRNSWAVWRWTRQNDFISDVEQSAWFERQTKDPSIRMYRIDFGTDLHRDPVGVCGFTSLDFANRRAEFSLYIAPSHQKMGFGKRALQVLLQHGFQNLGLNVIWGESFDGNPAIKMFESVGFTKEGTRRQFYWKDGQFVDAHLYSMTREEWLSKSTPS